MRNKRFIALYASVAVGAVAYSALVMSAGEAHPPEPYRPGVTATATATPPATATASPTATARPTKSPPTKRKPTARPSHKPTPKRSN